jgi:aromatic ring-opening dioxygenase LigB subunit
MNMSHKKSEDPAPSEIHSMTKSDPYHQLFRNFGKIVIFEFFRSKLIVYITTPNGPKKIKIW